MADNDDAPDGIPPNFAPLPWADLAKCLKADPEAFYPEKGGSTRAAKRMCARCDVRDECLEYALTNDERFGVWGGMSERERRRLRKLAGSPPAVASEGRELLR